MKQNLNITQTQLTTGKTLTCFKIIPACPSFSHGQAGRYICLQTQIKFNQNLLPMRKEN